MRILVIINPSRQEAITSAISAIELAFQNGIEVFTNSDELLSNDHVSEKVNRYQAKDEVDCAVVFGGDGTILRAAEVCHGTAIPIIGINLGNVGFLAEIQNPEITELINIIKNKSWRIEPRMTLDYFVTRNEQVIHKGWALNEITTERVASQMVELFMAIDNSPISQLGCDSLISATPTGSTAYAFSAGGPVVWPQVEAMIIVPVANHGLFSRPMVISDKSVITVEIGSENARVVEDGVRTFSLIKGDKITLTVSPVKIHLAHINTSVFADRLVAKFKLPIAGWRG